MDHCDVRTACACVTLICAAVSFFFEEKAFNAETGELTQPKHLSINKIGHGAQLRTPAAVLIRMLLPGMVDTVSQWRLGGYSIVEWYIVMRLAAVQ